MFGFKKKTVDLPGFSQNSQGKYLFDLTEEEKEAVNQIYSDFNRIAVREDIAKAMNEWLPAEGIATYARKQLMNAQLAGDKEKKEEFLKKALAAIYKSLSLSPISFYHFTLGEILEEMGRKELAMESYQKFLNLVGESEKQPFNETINIAREKLKQGL